MESPVGVKGRKWQAADDPVILEKYQKNVIMNKRNSIFYVLATLLFLSACNVPLQDNSSNNVVKDNQTAIHHESEDGTIVVPYRPGCCPDYVDEDKVYDVVEEMPSFPGGFEKLKDYLKDNMQYPKKLKGSGIYGRVIVTFIVEKDGSITKAKVVKSVHPALDKEALRVVKAMPKWYPGKHNGICVRVRYILPVTFKLQ